MNLSSRDEQTNDQKHPLLVRLRRVFFIILAGLFLCPLLFCCTTFSVALLSEPLARAMMPPVYPNSQLIGQENGGGSWGFTEIYRYSTSDSLTTVDDWYRNNAPNLERISSDKGNIFFDNPDRHSMVALIVGYINGDEWGDVPYAYLTASTDPEKPDLTQITIIIAWPAL